MLVVLAAALLQSPDADYQRGVELFRQGQLAGARDALLASIQRQPTARKWKTLGQVMGSGEQYAAAEAAFQEACRLDAQEEDACYFWARALYTLNRFEPALAALERVPAQAPRRWRVTLARGQALEALGRTDEAEAAFLAAMKERDRDRSAPSELDPIFGLCQFLYRQGRASQALDLLRPQAGRYRHVALWHFQTGRALLTAGQTEAAAEALKTAAALDPRHRETHTLLSKAYYRLGNPEQGKKHAQLALGQNR